MREDQDEKVDQKPAKKRKRDITNRDIRQSEQDNDKSKHIDMDADKDDQENL